MNLCDNVTKCCEIFQSKTSIIFYDKKYSYLELNQLIALQAENLIKLGFSKGDKLLILLPNLPEFVIYFYAIAKVGMISVLVNPLYQAYEIEHIIKDSNAKGIISHSFFWKKVENIKEKFPYLKTICVDKEGVQSINLQQKNSINLESEDVNENYPACLIYTNAESGTPYGAMLSHGNLDFDALASANSVNITENDILTAVIPLFHAFSLTVNMNMPLKLGGTIIINERYNLERLLNEIEKYKISVLVAVPKIFTDIANYDKIERYNFSSLRFGICGGAVLPISTTLKFQDTLKVPLLEGFGITECSPVCSVNTPEKNILGTIGPPLPNVQMKIFDEHNNELPIYKEGEICIFGKNVISEYHNNVELTSKTIRNGWFHTGDIGFKDENNYVTITGRKKRVIINGGFNVYCSEVEKVINFHPEVIDSFVYGTYNKEFGESVNCDIIIKENSPITQEEIKIHCYNYLAKYKCPRKINFVKEIDREKYSLEKRSCIIKTIREN